MEDAIRNGGGQSAVGRFIDLRQHERRIDGKSVEYLSCFGIVEGVETALERFAVKSQNGCAGGCRAAVEVCRVTAPPVVQQRQSVRPPRQARRRRAVPGQRDQMPTILCAEKTAAKHAPSESTDPAKGKEYRQSWITMSGSRTAFIRCHPDLPSEERPQLDWATLNVQLPHKASAPPSDSQSQSALRPGACRRRRYAIEAVFRSWKSPRAQSYRKLNGI